MRLRALLVWAVTRGAPARVALTMSTNPLHVPPAAVDSPCSRRSRKSRGRVLNTVRRYVMNHLVSGLAVLSTVLVIAPLVAILVYLIYKGASSLNLAFFTQIPAPVGETGGGMANAIVGSGIILGAGELDGNSGGDCGRRLPGGVWPGHVAGDAIRFTADVLNGVPSIVMGIAIYSLIVMQQKHFSAFAGGVALAIMMVPTITRTTEEMLATVPHAIREAALGLGVPKWRTVHFGEPEDGVAGHYHGLHAGVCAGRG